MCLVSSILINGILNVIVFFNQKENLKIALIYSKLYVILSFTITIIGANCIFIKMSSIELNKYAVNVTNTGHI